MANTEALSIAQEPFARVASGSKRIILVLKLVEY